MKKFRAVLSARFGTDKIKSTVLDRRVAETPWYHGDGAAITFLLLVQVVTGIFMTPGYSNSPDEAYESVRIITEGQVMGWMVRGIHYWSAGLMVVMTVFHLLRQILVGGYKAPREATWTIGVFLLGLVLIMSFTGYVLRWDERAIYAIRVALNMFYYVPWIGEGLVLFVQGDYEIGASTLTRIFSVHVVFGPLIMIGLVVYHVYLVVIHGVTSWAEREQPVRTAQEQKKVYKRAAEAEETGEIFHPVTVAKSGLMAFGIFAIAILLAVFEGPPSLAPEANLVERSMPAEEWWFWWYSALIALLPHQVSRAFLVVFPFAVFLSLLLLPLIDRGSNRGITYRPFAAGFVGLVVIAFIGLSALRLDSSWTAWPEPNPPSLPLGVEVTPRVEEGRRLFAKFGCNSCHGVAGQGREVGPDIAEIPGPQSLDELRNFVLTPPEGVAMPGYQGRMTEAELDRIVEFMHVIQTLPRRI